jgi:hypothetical protein
MCVDSCKYVEATTAHIDKRALCTAPLLFSLTNQSNQSAWVQKSQRGSPNVKFILGKLKESTDCWAASLSFQPESLLKAASALSEVLPLIMSRGLD